MNEIDAQAGVVAPGFGFGGYSQTFGPDDPVTGQENAASAAAGTATGTAGYGDVEGYGDAAPQPHPDWAMARASGPAARPLRPTQPPPARQPPQRKGPQPEPPAMAT